ncbi:MAG: acetyl-CoA carboxylase biotin carboxylase subunit [Planctomycetes bacterium]|nr:acetyl-CoA carboxylase biotin carboxylase subunit [Planctomycetota bacterium]
MFSRVLIANRGEIALRVLRACKEMGIETVLVFSRADAGAKYLEFADETVCIGDAAPAESYLNIPRIISAAEITNVDAIHPGYGFLAEEDEFAEICEESNIVFIGPRSEVMRKMGNKVQARKIAQENKVPVIPGSDDPLDDDDRALELAHQIGYPVMVKAAAGGGGRGMRIAHNDISLKNMLAVARSEADAAFKNSSVYIEKVIERARHVEVQIMADQHGNIVHLGERDCSIQRRFQKLIEETPSPGIDDAMREKITRAAVKIARAVEYTNAGTIEFLIDKDGNFYFIEMNARLQVEHPITEQVTGVDIVKEQLRAAAGEKMQLQQKRIEFNGASVECRINAENPADEFRTCPGMISQFAPPGGPGVRVDTHAYAGYEVKPFYDSLLAKLIVHQPTREEALACLYRALTEFTIEGIYTTIPFHRDLIRHGGYPAGNFDLGFVEDLLETG